MIKFKMRQKQMEGSAAAVFYGMCSVSIAIINKGLMTSFSFDYPVFIMVIQMLFTLVLLEALAFFNFISLPALTIPRIRMFFSPALFYGLNSVLGLNALSHMNVAIYGSLKRCVPLVTMFLSVVVLKKGWPSREIILSVLLITLGFIIAGYGDLEFNPIAYMSGLLSNFTHSLYLLLVQKVTEKDLSIIETLQLNSLITLPFLSLYFLLSTERHDVQTYQQWNSAYFWLLFLLTIAMGCLLNYSLFLCTSLNSALTTSVVGGVKALLQTIVGMFAFGGVSHNLATYVGIGINSSGSIMYLVAKYREKEIQHSKGIEGIHKVISVSTAEDFQKLEQGSIKSRKAPLNGLPLPSIPEKGILQNV